MELSRLIFFYTSGWNIASPKNKKNYPQKNVLYFGKWKFLTSRLKNSYISGDNFKVSSLKNFFCFFFLFDKT